MCTIGKRVFILNSYRNHPVLIYVTFSPTVIIRIIQLTLLLGCVLYIVCF